MPTVLDWLSSSNHSHNSGVFLYEKAAENMAETCLQVEATLSSELRSLALQQRMQFAIHGCPYFSLAATSEKRKQLILCASDKEGLLYNQGDFNRPAFRLWDSTFKDRADGGSRRVRSKDTQVGDARKGACFHPCRPPSCAQVLYEEIRSDVFGESRRHLMAAERLRSLRCERKVGSDVGG
jgi:hypothetical protein